MNTTSKKLIREKAIALIRERRRIELLRESCIGNVRATVEKKLAELDAKIDVLLAADLGIAPPPLEEITVSDFLNSPWDLYGNFDAEKFTWNEIKRIVNEVIN